MPGKKRTKHALAKNGRPTERNGRATTIACGRKNGRSRRILFDMPEDADAEELTPYDLRDELIGLKPHRKTSERTPPDRTRLRRHGVNPIEFAERLGMSDD